jgi:hypothetical protein
MKFVAKLNWDDLYDDPFSPVTDHDLIARESGLGVANRAEYKEKFGQRYAQKSFCAQMWTSPQINFDGRVIGCSINHWGDYGNAFTDGLLKILNNERMQYARRMLLGRAKGRADIACTTCKVYQTMTETGTWIHQEDIAPPTHRLFAAVASLLPKRIRQTGKRLVSFCSQR